MPKLSVCAPAPLRTRLWQGAFVVALIVASFLIANRLIGADRAVARNMLGHDFLAFYTAGTFASHGRFDELYDLGAVKEFQRQLAAENRLHVRDSFGPFWNPPFFAWVFAPMSKLPYHTSLTLWTWTNMLAIVGAIVLLVRMMPEPRDWKSLLLVPVLVGFSMPFLQAISHGQNSFISLFLLALLVTAWRARWDVSAGMICGLMFYKPQLAAIIAAVLVLSRGLRVCLGLAFVLGSLVLITALTMPDALGDYLLRLPQNVHFMQIQNTYLWERHVTLKGFWRLLLQGRQAGEAMLIVQMLTGVCALIVGAMLVRAAIISRRDFAEEPWTGETRSLRRDRLIAATVCAMPLLMPFYFDYDLLLLAVPAVLLAGEISSRAPGVELDASDKWLVRCWMALYAWLLVNPGLARVTGVNVTVLLLTTIAMIHLSRACRRNVGSTWGRVIAEVIPVTARRAA